MTVAASTSRVRLEWPDALRQKLCSAGTVVVWQEASPWLPAARGQARSLCRQLESALLPQQPATSRTATRSLVGVAMSRTNGIGLDVEAVSPGAEDVELQSRALHPRELLGERPIPPDVFCALWARKEAALKALGLGLAIDPRDVYVGPSRAEWSPVLVHGCVVASVRSIPALRGSVGALALRSGSPQGDVWVYEAAPTAADPLASLRATSIEESQAR